MPQTAIGLRIRERRKELRLAQSKLAEIVGISPAYLNLIERNKRGIAGGLLAKIARALGTDIAELDGSVERRLHEQLLEVAVDPELIALAGHPPAPDSRVVGEIIARFPDWARWLAHCHREFHAANDLAQALSQRLSQDPFLSQAVHNMLTEIAALGSSAQILVDEPEIEATQRQRFQNNIASQAERLAATGRSLADYFDIEVARRRQILPAMLADQWQAENRGTITALEQQLACRIAGQGVQLPASEMDLAELAAASTSRAKHNGNPSGALASQVAFILMEKELNSLPVQDLTEECRALVLTRLRRQLADSLMLPAALFHRAWEQAEGQLPELVRLLGGEVPRVLRRLVQLQPSGAESCGLICVDAAGNTLDRLSLPPSLTAVSDLSCARWLLYQAGRQPGQLLHQAVHLNGTDPYAFWAFAQLETGPDGAMIETQTTMMMMPALTQPGDGPRLPVGANCRICPIEDCQMRIDAPVVQMGTPGRSGR